MNMQELMQLYRDNIAKAEAAKRLANNLDYQRIVKKGYLEEELALLMQQLPGVAEEDLSKMMARFRAIALYDAYIQNVLLEGEQAEIALQNITSNQESM